MKSAHLLIATLTLIACNAYASDADTLSRIKSSGAITIGYQETAVPFSYLGDNAAPTGFTWEICQKIVGSVKKTIGRNDIAVKSQPVTGQNRIPLLVNGTIDLQCGSTTNNKERAKQVAFATNTFYTGTRFLVKSSAGIGSITDLKGKTVVSTVGSSNLLVLRRVNKERNLGMEIIAAKDNAEAMLLVQSGQAAAFGMDDILLYGQRAGSRNPGDYAIIGDAIQVEPFAIMLRRDDPEFKKLVDDTISGLMKSGEFDAMYKKWFETPIPPKGITLNVPMSQALRDNMKTLSDKPAL